jgi:hypothetical protein
VTTDLYCYGPDIEALADLVGDFDLRSPVDTRTWYRQTWETIAEALGFPQQLATELDRRRGTREWVTATGEAGMAESRCGWETPLVLHFGTFPWVYSSRLDAAGPGLRWISPSFAPALEGFHVMASFLQPEANLQQDARQVVDIYRHFAAQTAPLIARLPAYPSGRAAVGQLYQRAGLLHVHQGSLHVAGIDGPRGRLPALAYNYIVQRFASFFAVRRATLRALAWAPEMKRLMANTSDPCLRAQVEEVARAG